MLLRPREIARYVADRPLLSIGAVTLIAISMLAPYRNFAGDDAYITFRFAKNLASGQGLSFNPHEPTYGSTAPLWVFAVAGLSKAGIEVPDAAHLLNWIIVILLVPVFFFFARRYLGNGAAPWIASILLVIDPWFVRWAVSGLENALALLLVTATLLAQLQLRNSGRVNWVAPVLAGLAALCRPEMAILCVLVLTDNLLFERTRLRANLLAIVSTYIAIFVPWCLYAYSTFGTIVPNTVTAKISADYIDTLRRIALYFGSFWTFQALAIAAILTIPPLRRIAADMFRGAWTPWFLPMAWALSLPFFYLAGGAPVAGRYMMFALPCYLVVGVAAWRVIWLRHPRVVIAAFCATVILLLGVQYRYCWYITKWPQGIDPAMVEAAKTLERISRPGDEVAANQIGALGYFSDRYILDTFGLVSPEVFPYLDKGGGAIWGYVCERGVEFLFLSETQDELAAADPAYRNITVVNEFAVKREGATAATSLRTYYLYKTDWPDQC